MERICIAALTFFNVISYHTADSIIYFCAGNSSTQQKIFFMDNFMDNYKVEILNPLTKDSICSVICDSINLIDVTRAFSRSGYCVFVHPSSLKEVAGELKPVEFKYC